VADRIRFAVPQPTEWQSVGNQINAAFIFARTDFVNVRVHFLRNAAASFLTTHCSSTQISHNAIRNATTGSKQSNELPSSQQTANKRPTDGHGESSIWCGFGAI